MNTVISISFLVVACLTFIPGYYTQACRDNRNSCAYWARIGECTRNPKFMLPSCRKSCRVCGKVVKKIVYNRRVSYSASTVSRKCSTKDKFAKCSAWKKIGYCKKYAEWMKKYCCATCTKKVPAKTCNDQAAYARNCRKYKTWGYCTQTRYNTFMTKYCKRTCGKCPSTIIKKKKKVNGGYTAWSKYTKCSKKCGKGRKSRSRSCTNPSPKNGGKGCSGIGSAKEYKKCTLRGCPVNGGYSNWKKYSKCSKSCGTGTKERKRSCTKPSPKYGGKKCARLGADTQKKSCTIMPCPVVAAACLDEAGSSSCNSWKGYCALGSAFTGYMQKNCKKTCGICGAPPTDKPKRKKKTKKTKDISQKGCGRDKTFVEMGRVVGGVEAFPNSWQWQGAMYMDGEFGCGGSLIAPNLFLTAAHCTDGIAAGITIRMGDHNRTKNDKTEQERNVENIIVHSGYVASDVIDDIALMKVEGKFTLNKNVGIVCLPRENDKPPTTEKGKCYITGWGRTAWDEPTIDVLQEVKLPPVTNADCSKRNINPITGESQIKDTMLCAGYQDKNNKASGCRGDSGGPYVCKKKGLGKKWVLNGLVSWGSSTCENSLKYTVFTRIAKYLKWIKEAAATI